MRLNQLQFLVALKKHGTISKTAQKLFISQPSLSAAIKELEEELGFDIIKRTRKGVIFTTRGAYVLEHSQKALEEINEIKKLSLLQERALQGNLSIGCVPYICHTMILDTIMEMKKTYPKMVTNLREESSYDLLDLISRREVDLGIVMISNIEAAVFEQVFQVHSLQFKKLFDDTMYFWVGTQHPLYQQEETTMEEILQYPFITYRNVLNNFNRNMLLEYNKNLDFIQIDDKESSRKYLMKSQAVTVMPMCASWEDSYYQKRYIKPLKIKDFVWKVEIGMIYLKDELLSVEQNEFMRMLFEEC